ncbi:MAG TPA: dihydrofolate reductase family protein [Verrucomicrobiae bacterium]|nr:dihydrofolate reductase family protein [Verrucomicrobiae bacterium]
MNTSKSASRNASNAGLDDVWGSSELLQTLIAADLVDEYRLWVFPVILGKGKRLFENGVPPRGFSLVATQSTPGGVLLNTYLPAGPLPLSSEQALKLPLNIPPSRLP